MTHNALKTLRKQLIKSKQVIVSGYAPGSSTQAMYKLKGFKCKQDRIDLQWSDRIEGLLIESITVQSVEKCIAHTAKTFITEQTENGYIALYFK